MVVVLPSVDEFADANAPAGGGGVDNGDTVLGAALIGTKPAGPSCSDRSVVVGVLKVASQAATVGNVTSAPPLHQCTN